MNNITSRELFNIFLKNIIIIILSAVICASGAYIYCENFANEKFLAQGDILFTNGGINGSNDPEDTINPDKTLPENNSSNNESGAADGPVNNTDVSASINLMHTIRGIFKGVGIYREFETYLSEHSNYNINYKVLKSAAKVSNEEDYSLLLTISFELSSANEARDITNHFLKFAPEYIEKKLPGVIADPDEECDTPVQTAPRTLSTVSIAAVLGVVLSYTIAFLITIFNSTIKSDEDFSARYNIPVIGNIPDFSISHNNGNNGKPNSKKASGGKDNG